MDKVKITSSQEIYLCDNTVIRKLELFCANLIGKNADFDGVRNNLSKKVCMSVKEMKSDSSEKAEFAEMQTR